MKAQRRIHAACGVAVLLLLSAAPVKADDGYRLWLRYDKLPAPYLARVRTQIRSLTINCSSSSCTSIRTELLQGLTGLLGHTPRMSTAQLHDGSLIVGTPASSKQIALLHWDSQLQALGFEGFRIRSVRLDGRAVTVIAASGEIGVLYGVFHYLRLLQTLQPVARLNVDEKPHLQLRVLDHWDNLDGSIERGYAGHSLWNWNELPATIDPRLHDYARANASIGINGSVLNNVNATAQILTSDYLKKVAAIAGVFRPWGIRVYLSARFSAPIELGGLKTADPLDPTVATWWKNKADEIYRLIPDFGGFVVKANSEGQPGPRTYNRSHADGANMLAAAVASHGGVIMWRAFVYDVKPDYDRAGAAYENLQPFDGHFASNVLLQVKNGPIDFQPREPFHPLFGAMPKTQVIPELQITQEYMGFSNHLVYLGTMWREFLDSDTFARGRGSTVSHVVDGSLFGQHLTGIAGVANTGSDRNWTGHNFAQSNWYAFGRLAWNPELRADKIAREWIRMTFTTAPEAVASIARIMLDSHEAAVNYMTPLGLHHIMWAVHHYGPAPWWNTETRADWNPVYYHRADANGLGFDRTRSGSDTVSQYFPPVRDRFSSLDTCPDEFLLWFHHVSWNYRLHSGQTLWNALALHYQHGVDWVRATRREWDSLSNFVDPQRQAAVARKLAIQERDAVWWRDACLIYFQTYSNLPLPPGVDHPAHTLDEYKSRSLLTQE